MFVNLNLLTILIVTYVLIYSHFFFLMIRRPPRSTLFPTRRSSDLFRAGDRCGRHGDVPPRTAPRRHGLDRHRLCTGRRADRRSEEHTSELQSLRHLVCRLLLEKKKTIESEEHC